VILLDTSGLLAALDASQRHHKAAARALLDGAGPRILSPFVLAELDYLLSTKVSAGAALSLLDEVARGVYSIAPFDSDDVSAARQVLTRYADQDLGLADASIVVLSERHGTSDVLTLDERHFRTLRSRQGRRFRILPADAS
jgi:uncharacterized protein